MITYKDKDDDEDTTLVYRDGEYIGYLNPHCDFISSVTGLQSFHIEEIECQDVLVELTHILECNFLALEGRKEFWGKT